MSDNKLARVLVVDGNAIDRLLTQSLLESSGYAVDVAIDGPHAVEWLSGRRHYGLVIVGGGETGAEHADTARQIRALRNRSSALPILALATADDPPVARLFDGCVQRNAAEIVARVAEYLGTPQAAEAATAEDTPPLVDAEQLDRLAKKLPSAKLRALLGSYRDGHDTRVARIEAMLESANLAGLAREAHDIKSTAGTFGTPRLGRLARCLERACEAEDLDGAKIAFDAIRTTAAETWPVFERAAEEALRQPAEPVRPSARVHP